MNVTVERLFSVNGIDHVGRFLINFSLSQFSPDYKIAIGYLRVFICTRTNEIDVEFVSNFSPIIILVTLDIL